MSRPNLLRGLLAGAAAGVVASYVKSLAEPRLQTLGEAVFPPTAAQKALPGADIDGHPERMPPATLAQEVTPETLSTDEKLEAQSAIHYTFGALTGAAYGALAEVAPLVTWGFGVPAAVALWAGTHGTTLPAAGLQADPDDLPASAHVWEGGSHLVFGATVEAVRRLLRG